MFVFVCGATFYSIIYGNIGQFVGNLYQAPRTSSRRHQPFSSPAFTPPTFIHTLNATHKIPVSILALHFCQAGLRYRKRIEQINEFSQFHSLSPVLMKDIHKYVNFSFAVTNGLSVDSIA